MTEDQRADIPDLKEHLLTRILPFWEKHSIDRDRGGFLTHLARDGSVTDDSAKYLVMQARMIYSFVAGAEVGGPPQWVNLARQGAGFLLRRFRDMEQDGWFWSVDRAGAPLETDKRMYGHAFVIYALSEYGRVARDNAALAAAAHTWSLVANHLWDDQHKGVFEACDRAWRPLQPGHSMGTHLHTVEALLALNQAAGDSRYWPQVRAICDLLVTHMVHPERRCALEKFSPDWVHDGGNIDYGHNLEAAWLLLRVHELEGNAAYRDTARGFLDYALRYGLDRVHGGVFSHGPLGQDATLRRKVWWVQTEAIPAFLLAYLVFGEQQYWEAFANVIQFCLRHLHDEEHGEWYHSAEEDGAPHDPTKGSAWKAAYHLTQALVYGHGYLERIRGRLP